MGGRHERDLLAAAVSPLVAGALAGPPTPRRVLGVFATSVYIDLGAHERVLALLAADALHLPIGLRLAQPASTLSWGVQPGDDVLVGAGRVQLPGAEVFAARLARPARVLPRAGLPTGAAVDLLPDAGVLGELSHDLTTAALTGRPVDDAVLGLVGAGRGLTPSGDDALCGVVLALASTGHPCAATALAAVRDAMLPALGRTTSISAALLMAAASGYAVPDVVRLVHHLGEGGPGADRTAYGLVVERVLGIGHTSGRDLLAGVSGALHALADILQPHPASPPPEEAHRD
jgi:hypothetical protein